MYLPSSSSSSCHGSMGPSGSTSSNSGLIRYGSAPGSLLTTAVDSVVGRRGEFSPLGSSHHPHMGPTRFFPKETSSLTSASETTAKSSNNNTNREQQQKKGININTAIGLPRSYGPLTHEGTIGSGAGIASSSSTSGSPLIRHSSSPAGFLNHLSHVATSNDDSGFSMTRATGISRLSPRMSFTRQETLSQISEERENVDTELNRESDQKKSTHSYATTSYNRGSWTNAKEIMFSMEPSKRSKHFTSEVIDGPNSMETQFLFSDPQKVLDVTTMENFLNIPQDSVRCKIRAKRGFATHPRSIAERERRTRISGKLKKLQELVPNMDKQTSYADMLDLAVQHIKGLQNQVQMLNKELENCTCGCKKPKNTCGQERS